MQSIQPLTAISDDELLRRLAALVADSRRTEADLVLHIAEVDARKLYAREATPSMFQYCTERLHLSGAEAYLRIPAGRAAREHPVLLTMLADGRLHLTAIALLAPHLTAESRDVLLARATHKTKREIEALLAEIAPRPDAPAVIRKLPDRWTTRPPALASRPSVVPSCAPPPSGGPASLWGATHRAACADIELRPDGVGSHCSGGMVSPAGGMVSSPGGRAVEVSHRTVIEPLSPARYRVQFTASAELRDKLERLQALMRASVPGSDLATIIDAAVTEKLERLESRRFGCTKAPRKSLAQTDTSPSSRHVPAAVRRAVHERDQGRCRYVDEQGRRCTGRVAVEYHHRHPFGMGGDHSPAGVSLLCHAHNLYLAEIDYGCAAAARRCRSSAAASGGS